MKRRDLLKSALALIYGLAFLRPAKATPGTAWRDLGIRKREPEIITYSRHRQTHEVVVREIRAWPACRPGQRLAIVEVTLLFDSPSMPGEFINPLNMWFEADWERRFDLLEPGAAHRVTSEWRCTGKGHWRWWIVAVDGVKI